MDDREHAGTVRSLTNEEVAVLLEKLNVSPPVFYSPGEIADYWCPRAYAAQIYGQLGVDQAVAGRLLGHVRHKMEYGINKGSQGIFDCPIVGPAVSLTFAKLFNEDPNLITKFLELRNLMRE